MTESQKAQAFVREVIRQSEEILGGQESPNMTMIVMLVTPTGGVAANYRGKPLSILGLLELMSGDMRDALRAALGNKHATMGPGSGPPGKPASDFEQRT